MPDGLISSAASSIGAAPARTTQQSAGQQYRFPTASCLTYGAGGNGTKDWPTSFTGRASRSRNYAVAGPLYATWQASKASPPTHCATQPRRGYCKRACRSGRSRDSSGCRRKSSGTFTATTTRTTCAVRPLHPEIPRNKRRFNDFWVLFHVKQAYFLGNLADSPCFGSKGSQVQILPLRPIKSIG